MAKFSLHRSHSLLTECLYKSRMRIFFIIHNNILNILKKNFDRNKHSENYK